MHESFENHVLNFKKDSNQTRICKISEYHNKIKLSHSKLNRNSIQMHFMRIPKHLPSGENMVVRESYRRD